MRFSTTLSARVKVLADDKGVFDETFTGSASGGNMWGATSEYEAQLTAAHQSLLEQIIPAILRLFSTR